MISDLKPYPEMKDSGVPWLGEVPAHWAKARLKHYYREVDERSVSGQEELLSVSHKTGVTPRSQKNVTMFMARSYVDHKKCAPGDVVVNTMWAWMGALGVAPQCGIVSPSYAVYRPRRADVLPPYADALLRTPGYVYEYNSRSTGVTASRLRLYPDQFLRVPAVCPPIPEQAAIVRFLDHAGRRIGRYTRAKQKLINLLEEQRWVIIHRSVTRGLNPNVRFKPSGVEWLGEVPEHWETVPLKRIAWFKSGAGFPVEDQGCQDLEIPFLKVSDMNLPGNDAWTETATSTVSRETAARLGALVFPVGSIIFPKVGGALLTNKRRLLRKPSCIDNNVMGCVVDAASLPFVYLLLRQLDLGRLAKPGPVPAIGEGDVREIKVALPPIDEQEAIVRIVERAAAHLDQAIVAAGREIGLLREYRTRLIADVVTGKLDVRELAANLSGKTQEEEQPELGLQGEEDDDHGDDEGDEDAEDAEQGKDT